ncbi:hypothetical protein HNQ69_001308 [Bartonella callosciuri]|uniref:Uncharacterized protein n=1 Tax=Bartonella callosciuri TaxID=686223 RepID=A0A840NSY4_9HYPH|nr:hypothetical protein [Bartonella callosciuri]MBB5074171.1 hypothetical protein [Bartonella callosciuri]
MKIYLVDLEECLTHHLFYNGDGGRNLNMKAQKIAFLSQLPKAEIYLKYTLQEALQKSL